MASDPIRIIRFEVRGWAGIDHVEILNPSPHLVEFVSAENAAGKTSLLDALRGTLAGAEAVTDGVIRQGSSKAECEIDLGPVTVRCTVSQKGRNLTVRTSDGLPIPKQQAYLDGKLGRLLAPAEFRTWGTSEQLVALQQLAGPEWTARRAELVAAHKAAYEERTLAGRAVKSLGAPPAPVAQAEPVDVSALARQLQEAEAHNRAEQAAADSWDREQTMARTAWEREQDRRVAAASSARDQEQYANQKVMRIRAELAIAEAELQQMVEQSRRFEAELQVGEAARPEPALPRPEPVIIDTASLRAALDGAQAQSARAAAWQDYCRKCAVHADARAEHEAHEAAVTAADLALAEHDATADLPERLVVAPDGITYQGRPLARMSTGEGLRLAFAVACHLGARILICDNAEALGPSTVADVAQLAEQHDVQVVMATRGTAHTPGAYELRDGRLVEHEADPGEDGGGGMVEVDESPCDAGRAADHRPPMGDEPLSDDEPELPAEEPGF